MDRTHTGPQNMQVSVSYEHAGGHKYPFALGDGGSLPSQFFDSEPPLTLPPGINLCGWLYHGATLTLQATGQVPASAIPSTLTVDGLEPAAINGPPTNCTPDVSSQRPIPADVTLAGAGSAKPVLRISKVQNGLVWHGSNTALVTATLRNDDQFDSYQNIVSILTVDDGGVMNGPAHAGDGCDDANSGLGSNTTVVAGPLQGQTVAKCYEYRPGRPVAAVLIIADDPAAFDWVRTSS